MLTVPKASGSNTPLRVERARLDFLRASRFYACFKKYQMVAPTVTILFALTIYPMVYMVWISLHEWPIIATLPRRFEGLEQYEYLLFDRSFWDAVCASATYLTISVTLQVGLGFAFALLLSVGGAGTTIVRLLFMLPLFISPVVAALIWKFMLGYDLGILNYFIRSIGLPPVNWLGGEGMAMASLILVDVWQWTPFSILILLAGLASLPSEPYEAAVLDGASPWQTFLYITLPMMLPALAVVVLFRTVDAFKMFDLAYVLTRGGPGDATNVLALEVWRRGFFENQMGAAAAISVFMVVIALGLVSILAKLVKI
jgi:multiple sugar transport system permease protein